MGAPDLDLLWEALSQMQRRVAASEAEGRRMQALAAAKPAPSGGGLLDLSFDVVSSAVVSSLGLAASRDRSREPSSVWAEMVPSIGGGGDAPLDDGQPRALGTKGSLVHRADSGLMRRADSGLVRRADGGLVRRASYVAPKTAAEASKVGSSDEQEAEGDGGATTATGAALATLSTAAAGANAEPAAEKAAGEKAAGEKAAAEKAAAESAAAVSAAVDQAAVDQAAADKAAAEKAAAEKAAAEKAVTGKASEDPSGWSADGLWVGRGPSPPAPRPPPPQADVADELRLSIFEAWHSALRGTVHPSVAWRRRLGLEARELLIMRASRSSVRDQSLGMPGLLVLTSERLIFGSLVFGAGFGFRTAASLHALRAVQPAASTLGEALLRINIDGPGAEPVVLRFGRGAAARAQRDRWLASLEPEDSLHASAHHSAVLFHRWLASLELMRRAYLHAWALGTDTPIARAGHCVACAASLSDPADGAPLLDLLPALPPRVRASRDSREMADRWQLVPLSGACASEPGLRIVSIAAAGSGLAICTSDGTLILYKVCLARLAADLTPPPLIPSRFVRVSPLILPSSHGEWRDSTLA